MKPDKWTRADFRQWLLFLLPALLLGGLVRCILLADWKDGFYFGPDSEGYWRAAFSWFHGHGFAVASKRSWGYPLLLLLTPLGPISPGWTAAFLQHFIGWLALFPLAAIVRRLIPEWRWFLIPITVVYACDPLLVFWEHIMIADSLLVTFGVMIAWAALVYWQRPSWKILALILGLLFFSMSVRPVGRALWAGVLPIIILVPGLEIKKRLLHLAVALVFIFPAMALTKVRQGDDLLFGSVFPYIPTTGGPHAEYKAELVPLIENGRSNLWQFVRRGQKEVFVLTFGKSEQEIGPKFSALMQDQKAFAKVRHDLSLEALRRHPLGCAQITLLKLYSVFADDLKSLRLRPQRYNSIHHKFLEEANRRIDPRFAAWFLGDLRADNSEGIRQVLRERVQPGPLGQSYLALFPKLEKHYHLYRLKDLPQLSAPTSALPLVLFLFGIIGWFILRCGSGLIPLLSLNLAYLALTYGVGRAVQRYRLPSEYFFILGVFLGILVLARIIRKFVPRNHSERSTATGR